MVCRRWFFPLVLCASAWAEALTDSVPAWYCQIGRWNLVKDSTAGVSYFSHDAARDGAQSGLTTSNVKLNHVFRSFRRIDVRLVFPVATAGAGILLKSKFVSYQVIVERKAGADSVRVLRREKNRQSTVAVLRVTTVRDTSELTVQPNGDRLDILVNGAKTSITRPPEFGDFTHMGLVCPQGSVRVPYVHVEAEDRNFSNAVTNAQLLNLQMEKTFRTGAKAGR